ncbi:MAG: hypothetical protein H6711_31755 [Myxococcales bacterium]|nr:hypothetical protein [Myxococcales bacterium]
MRRLALLGSLLLMMGCRASSGGPTRAPEAASAAGAAAPTRPSATEAEVAPPRGPWGFAAVERAYHEALTRDARSRGAFEGLARLYYERGMAGSRGYLDLAERVIAQGERALAEVGERSAELAHVQGLVWLARERPDFAGESLRRALAIDPAHARAALNLARLEILWRDPAAALRHLAIAGRDPALELEVRLSEGVAHLIAGEAKSAIAALERAQALAPDDPRPPYNLGVVMIALVTLSEDVESMREHNRLARAHLERFERLARLHPELADELLQAQDHIVELDEIMQGECKSHITPDIRERARALEEIQREQEAEQRARLLELERLAAEAEEAAER